MKNQKMLEYQAISYLENFDKILRRMSRKMLYYNMTNNITINFIDCMIFYNQAGIYMCENFLEYTNNSYLRDLSFEIIKFLRNSVDQMLSIRGNISKDINDQNEVNNYISNYFAITKSIIWKMKNNARTININLNFISQMIVYFEGAISLCQNVLQYRIDPRLKILVNSMIEVQRGILEKTQQNRLKNSLGTNYRYF